MKPQPLVLVFLYGLILVGTPLAIGAKPAREPVPVPVETDPHGMPLFHQGMVTVKFHEGVGPFSRQEGMVSFGISSLDEVAGRFRVNSLEKRFRHRPIPKDSGLPDLSRIYRIRFPESFSVRAVAEAFERDPLVEYAEPIPVLYACEVPNDPLYSQLQHLPQIMAPEAWDIHHGEDGPEHVVIGIADDAVEWFHPDLIDNTWQ
ncbi:MAG: S8 family serine peptidase, partial [Anaerolineales bacterium]